jgi:cell division protein ZapA
MDDRSIMLDVAILGREYRVSCKESEREELQQAVQFLDRRMREIRDSGKIAGTERIAVMAALNMAHELLRVKAGAAMPVGAAGAVARVAFDSASLQRRISAMQTAIDRAMADQEKLF